MCADLCEPGLYSAVMGWHCSPPPGQAQPLQGLQQVIQGLLLPQAGALVRQLPQLQGSLSSLARHLFYPRCTCGVHKDELAQGFWLRASRSNCSCLHWVYAEFAQFVTAHHYCKDATPSAAVCRAYSCNWCDVLAEVMGCHKLCKLSVSPEIHRDALCHESTAACSVMLLKQ